MTQPFLQRKKPSFRTFIWIGGVVIFLLLITTVTLAYLYIQDRKQRDFFLVKLQETKQSLDQLYLSMAQGELKKAFSDLDHAQKVVSDLLPRKAELAPQPVAEKKPPPVALTPPSVPTPVAPPAKPPVTVTAKAETVPPPAKPQPSAVPAGLSMAADEDPYPLLQANAGEYLLVCEKDQKTLHLFRYTDKRFVLIRSYACIVGANGLDKKKEGDLATPLGNYFSLRYIDGKSLPEKYGHGAFVLNYPNFLDRKDRKYGTGIWLHGHTPGLSLGDPQLQNTSGCIVVANDVLKHLTEILKASGTPVVVVNRLQFAKTSLHQQLSKQIDTFLTSWSKAWESGKTDAFMRHYASDFINSDGMNYQAFKRQKEKVNSSKKFIRVTVENPAILLPQEKGGEIAVVRFTQRYRSNNFESDTRKLFYLKKGQAGWQIIGESRF